MFFALFGRLENVHQNDKCRHGGDCGFYIPCRGIRDGSQCNVFKDQCITDTVYDLWFMFYSHTTKDALKHDDQSKHDAVLVDQVFGD